MSPSLWIRCAEAAFATAEREFLLEGTPNPSVVCHQAHRSAVAYLRARLLANKVNHPDISHPVVLLECCLDIEPTWESYRENLRTLHVNALDAEDPVKAFDLSRAQESLLACTHFRQAAQAALSSGRPTQADPQPPC